jgi:hypothetical protein
MVLPDINITEGQWLCSDTPDKKVKLEEVLSYLKAIDDGLHPASGTERAGIIPDEKKALESFVFKVILWERQIISEETL